MVPYRLLPLVLVLLAPALVRAQCTSTITTFPYNEGFEASAAWTAGGYASDWAWGTPAHSLINSAAGGTRAWCVGGLAGSFYNLGQQSWLESPCFNISSLPYPWISFKLFWEVERQYDGLGFQYSLDQGATWTNLGSVAGSTSCLNQNWFNTTTISSLNLATPKQGWSGRVGATTGNCMGGQGSGQWVTASHCLSAIAGATSVKFRFIFGAGTTCNNYDGIGLDDVFIGNAPPNAAAFAFECQGTAVSFQDQSALCPGSFQWNFGDPGSGTLNQSTSPAPVHTFPGPGVYQVSLTVSGPCNAPSTVILPVTVPEVTLTVQDPSCTGNDGTITAVVAGAPAGVQYTWTPAGPSGPVNSGLPPGGYSVLVHGPGLCAVQVSAQLVEQASTLVLQATSSDVACAGGADGSAQVAASGSVGTLAYSWSPGGATTAVVSGLAAGSYSVTVTDATNCPATAAVVVAEPAPLELLAASPIPLCAGSSVVLQPQATGGVAPYSFTFLPEGPLVSPDITTDHLVSVVDANGCTAAPQVFTVLVDGPPPPVVVVVDPQGCEPHCPMITSSGSGTFTWDTGNGTVVTSEGLLTPCLPAGTYAISVTVTDAQGCSNTGQAAVPVVALPTPSASFIVTPSVATMADPTFTFHSNSSGASVQLWSFGDAAGTTADGPVATMRYPAVDCHTVLLSVMNEEGCADEASAEVCVEEEFAVYAPNAFTPDADGINDVFRIFTSVRSPRLYELLIHDRWGHALHVSTDHQSGWDGRTRGSDLPDGVYVWTLRIRDSAGELRELRGHVTLLR
jgi:gliding motility-associated-like protein